MTVKRSILTIEPPRLPPGPVSGEQLNQIFVQLYRDVLSKMDLRYSNNDFGGLGTAAQVLTSNGPNTDPTWQAAGGGGSVANPTAKVGLSAVNGSASSAIRSDGAPPLDQSIAPTWTGTHTFNPGATNAIVIESGDLSTNGSAGTSGFVLESLGANTPPNWISPLGLSGQVKIFDQTGGASQTYNPPSGCHFVTVICIGGGGGGGSGGKGSNASNWDGGGGGGAGGISIATFLASVLGSGVTITFSNAATGGNGGASQTTSGLQGVIGTAGSNAQFGTWLIAYGGNPGLASGTGGTGGTGSFQTGTAGGVGGSPGGGSGVVQTNGSGATTDLANTGGGAGGGLATTTPHAGGNGGGAAASLGFAAGFVGGLGGAATGQPGNIALPGTGGDNGFAAAGSGGGGAFAGASNGGQGGGPGAYGSGGGGGGATNTGNSGAGGQGGYAAVICMAW